ncbi:MAG TPA: chemotaxis protein CheW [Candidatus Xenobia bacterium]
MDDWWFAVDVHRIQEVVVAPELTPVPLAPALVRGLINLRGDIVIAIDLKGGMGLACGQGTTHLVLAGELISLVVDRAGEVVEVDPATSQKPPDTLSGGAREVISGACRVDDRLLLMLDLDRVAHPKRVAVEESS